MVDDVETHEKTIALVLSGKIRCKEEAGELSDREREYAKLACYSHLQKHRNDLLPTLCRLKNLLPRSFHDEIRTMAQNIFDAEWERA